MQITLPSKTPLRLLINYTVSIEESPTLLGCNLDVTIIHSSLQSYTNAEVKAEVKRNAIIKIWKIKSLLYRTFLDGEIISQPDEMLLANLIYINAFWEKGNGSN